MCINLFAKQMKILIIDYGVFYGIAHDEDETIILFFQDDQTGYASYHLKYLARANLRFRGIRSMENPAFSFHTADVTEMRIISKQKRSAGQPAVSAKFRKISAIRIRWIADITGHNDESGEISSLVL